ncbi:MAG: GNAT family N-acetyltransferase [Acidimicrobiales bacterium]
MVEPPDAGTPPGTSSGGPEASPADQRAGGGDTELEVGRATAVDDELVVALGALVPQLSRSSPPPTAAELAALVESPGTTLFVARDGPAGPIVGTLTLVVFRIPTGLRAWIEDVIVDESVRGRGGGEALTRAALGVAAELGARTVELTSRPSRVPANRLYQRIGFVARETNVYRFTLG